MEGSGSVHQSFPVSTPNLDAFDGTDHDDHQTLTMQQRSQSAQGYRQELHQPLSEGISLASPSSHHERLTGWTNSDAELIAGPSTSVDFPDQETEDISHVSYLIERDRSAAVIADAHVTVAEIYDQRCLLPDQDITDCIDCAQQAFEVSGLVSGDQRVAEVAVSDKSVSEDISYVLRAAHGEDVSVNSSKDGSKRKESRSRSLTKKKRPTMQSQRRVFGNAYDYRSDQRAHPTLFAKATRLGGRQKSNNFPSPFALQFHFVSMHSLPSFESYSYHDDTLSDPLEELINRKLEKIKQSRSRSESNAKIPSHHKSEDLLMRSSPDRDEECRDRQRPSTSHQMSVSTELIDFDVDSEADFASMELIPSVSALDAELASSHNEVNNKRAINDRIILDNMKVHMPDDFDKELDEAVAALTRYESERDLHNELARLLHDKAGSASCEAFVLETLVISHYLASSGVF